MSDVGICANCAHLKDCNVRRSVDSGWASQIGPVADVKGKAVTRCDLYVGPALKAEVPVVDPPTAPTQGPISEAEPASKRRGKSE